LRTLALVTKTKEHKELQKTRKDVILEEARGKRVSKLLDISLVIDIELNKKQMRRSSRYPS